MNYLEALNYGNNILKSSNITNYNLDTQIILSKVLNLPRETLLINLTNNLEKTKGVNFLTPFFLYYMYGNLRNQKYN